MNEEEAIYYLKKILFKTTEANKCGLSNNDFTKDIECYETILGIIEKQNQVIKKAIEYMESWGKEPSYGMEIQMKEDIYFQELLKILKGSDK